MTINERLDEMQKRADAATQGPWVADSGNDENDANATSVRQDDSCHESGGFWIAEMNDHLPDGSIESNSVFIAAARQDVPALIAEVQRLRQLCCNIHDRILRGAEDSELRDLCDEANSDELTKLK